jgi:hypothetical protein
MATLGDVFIDLSIKTLKNKEDTYRFNKDTN